MSIQFKKSIPFTGRNFGKIPSMSIFYEAYGRKIGQWLGFVEYFIITFGSK